MSLGSAKEPEESTRVLMLALGKEVAWEWDCVIESTQIIDAKWDQACPVTQRHCRNARTIASNLCVHGTMFEPDGDSILT